MEIAEIDTEFLDRFEGTDVLDKAALFFHEQEGSETVLSLEELKAKTITISNGEEIGFDDINRAIKLDADITYLKMLKYLEEIFLTSLDLTHIMQSEVDETPVVQPDGIRFSSILIYAPYETAVVYFGIKYMGYEQTPTLHNSIMKHLDNILTKSGLSAGIMEAPLTEEQVKQFTEAFPMMEQEIEEVIEAYNRANRVFGSGSFPQEQHLN